MSSAEGERGQQRQRKIGRPRRYASADKRPTLTFRARGDLYEQLKEAALSAERSLSEEIEHRLVESFAGVDQFSKLLGGPHNASLVSTIVTAVRLAEIETGKTWRDDVTTNRAVKTAIARVIELLNEPAPQNQVRTAETLINLGEAWRVGAAAGDEAVRWEKARLAKSADERTKNRNRKQR